MKHRSILLTAAAVCLFAAQSARVRDLKIIANPGVGASSVSGRRTQERLPGNEDFTQ